jgi:CheY-like chemotaxis protein
VARILVVDDLPDNRDVLCRALRLFGHTVQSASNGHEAVETARSTPPDLILMDLSMPGMDGWTTTMTLKADRQLAHIPVIAVTGHVTPDEIQRALDAGCADYVAKPVDFETLMSKVGAHAPVGA